MGQGIVLIM